MPRLRRALPLLLLALACGKDDGSTDGASDGTSGGTSSGTSSGTSGGTSGGDTSTSDTPTTGGTTATTGGTDGETGGTSGEGSSTSTTSTTGVDVSGFERFTMTSAAGPCPPNGDCDGFVELLADGLLRVEKFGDVGDPVTEVAISPEDLAAAAAVFSDPALSALLDGPEPLCNPPTDVFEGMLVVIDGVSHDAVTTTCDQPPIAAARDMAIALRDEYAP